jgi:hypothetical protein
MKLLALLTLLATAASAQTSIQHIQAQLGTAVKLKKAKPGDKLKATTVASVTLANGTAIPSGSLVLGHVLQADASSLTVSFDTANVDGRKIPLNITLVAIAKIGGSSGSSNAKMNSPSPDDHPLDGRAREAVQAGSDILSNVGHESLSEVNAGAGNSDAKMVPAHPGSVIGLPGITLAVDEAPPFASKFTIATKDMQLPDGIQLMFSVRP